MTVPATTETAETDHLGGLHCQQHGQNGLKSSRRSLESIRTSVSLDGIFDTANEDQQLQQEHFSASKKGLSQQVERSSTWPAWPSRSSDADWIFAIYGTLDVPQELRASFHKKGFTLFGRFVLTGVEGTTKDGRCFEWSTRRQRKGLGPVWKDDPAFHAASIWQYFDWMYRPQLFHHSPQLAVSYWGALSFFVGGFLFMLSNLAQIFPQAAANIGMSPKNAWGHDLYDWLGALPACVGLYIVMIGHTCKYLEVLNAHYPRRMDKFHRGSSTGKKYRKPSSYGLQGHAYPVRDKRFVLDQGWVVYFPFVLGPAFLAVGGLFIIWESSGKLYRGGWRSAICCTTV
ncbi:hypothetical protein WJX84_002960 [Apatococcus fuscideae]|uniref:Uncharacterized protein n=1 Tax=Apatococcus fuscideae TaxID=2026836 RepID=A0AAW1TM87_9CHLO